MGRGVVEGGAEERAVVGLEAAHFVGVVGCCGALQDLRAAMTSSKRTC